MRRDIRLGESLGLENTGFLSLKYASCDKYALLRIEYLYLVLWEYGIKNSVPNIQKLRTNTVLGLPNSVAERSKAIVCGFESLRGHGCLSL